MWIAGIVAIAAVVILLLVFKKEHINVKGYTYFPRAFLDNVDQSRVQIYRVKSGQECINKCTKNVGCKAFELMRTPFAKKYYYDGNRDCFHYPSEALEGGWKVKNYRKDMKDYQKRTSVGIKNEAGVNRPYN